MTQKKTSSPPYSHVCRCTDVPTAVLRGNATLLCLRFSLPFLSSRPGVRNAELAIAKAVLSFENMHNVVGENNGKLHCNC